MASPIVAGVLAAALVSGAARRLGMLTGGGMVAATAVGAAAVAAGWLWAGLLLAFFVTSIAWTKAGAVQKGRHLTGRVAKSQARDAMQVLANGGVFAACAFTSAAITAADGAITPTPSLGIAIAAAALGALAAACADTWATEIGMLSSKSPRSIVNGDPVPAGASGGVTALGMLAGLAGGLLISLVAAVGGLGRSVAFAGLAGGIIGMLADSLLGATVQSKRWCDRCGESTEQHQHTCGTVTRNTSGFAWLNNDGVNALATVAGAVTALGVQLAVSR